MKNRQSQRIPTTNADQAKAFRKAARELGADPDDGRFQAALRKVAKHKPVEQRQRDKTSNDDQD